MTQPSLSIVILNYNTCDLLDTCLKSVQKQASEAEVIVVDNASSDASPHLVRRQYPGVRLIASDVNLGFGRGMNLGLKAATAPAILALNADTELLPTTLPPLLQALSQLPRAGILGPTQYLPHPHHPGQPGRQLASAYFDPTLLHEAGRLLFFIDTLAARLQRGPWSPYSGPPRPVDWLMGSALLIRRECLAAIGGFDETQFMYGEDWDLCYRARQAGWQVYLVPEAQIIHHENAAGRQAFGPGRKARVLQANLYFHEKHFGRTSRRFLAGLYLLGAALRLGLLLLARPVWASRPALRERSEAHRQEMGVALRQLL